MGTVVAQWLRFCAGVNGIFHWHKILPIALWPWGWLSFLQKWVPGAFPGGKGGGCVRLTTLQPSCAVVMKSGNLNFLEPSGPLQACNGTALPFYTQTMITESIKTAVLWFATPGSQKICCNEWKEHAAFILGSVLQLRRRQCSIYIAMTLHRVCNVLLTKQ